MIPVYVEAFHFKILNFKNNIQTDLQKYITKSNGANKPLTISSC